MITDSCKCGSVVTIKHRHFSEESLSHHSWLKSHSACRDESPKIKNSSTESEEFLDLKYKGQDAETGEWVQGQLIVSGKEDHINPAAYILIDGKRHFEICEGGFALRNYCEVFPETIEVIRKKLKLKTNIAAANAYTKKRKTL